ncbi:MAG: lysylphosphatidylglycerol synthase transmembrane domain-containing protein [Candidatus Nealsonbacteria bacterium]
MKKLLLFLTSSCFGIGLFFWVMEKIGWDQIWATFRNFSIWSIFIILGLSILIILVGSRKWQIILKSQGYKLPFSKVLKAYLIGFSLDYLTPFATFGGEIVRGYSLKEDSLSWEKIIASIGADKILDCSVVLFTIASGLLLFNYRFGTSLVGSKIIFAISVLIILTVLFFYFKVRNKESIVRFFIQAIGLEKSKSGEVVVNVEKEIFSIFRQKKHFAEIFSLTILRWAVFLIRHWVLLYLLGIRIDILGAFSILSFTFLTYFLPTPALLGSHEVVQSLIFPFYGFSSGAGAAFTLILRTGDLFAAFLGIALLFHSWWGVLFEFLKRRFKIK